MLLTACELKDALAEIESIDDAALLDSVAYSIREPQDYQQLLPVIARGEDISSAIMSALFWAGGVIGIGDAIGAAINDRSRGLTTGASSILAQASVLAADVTAFAALMSIVPGEYDIDILDAQREVMEGFPTDEEFRRLGQGELFENGLFIREQLSGMREPRVRRDILLAYLRIFAGAPIVDHIFYGTLESEFGELALTALVGFGRHVLTEAEVRSVPVRSENSLICVANMTSMLFEMTGLQPYATYLSELVRSSANARMDRLLEWTLSQGKAKFS